MAAYSCVRPRMVIENMQHIIIGNASSCRALSYQYSNVHVDRAMRACLRCNVCVESPACRRYSSLAYDASASQHRTSLHTKLKSRNIQKQYLSSTSIHIVSVQTNTNHSIEIRISGNSNSNMATDDNGNKGCSNMHDCKDCLNSSNCETDTGMKLSEESYQLISHLRHSLRPRKELQ